MDVDPTRAQRYIDKGLWSDDRIGDLIPRRAAEFPDRELFVFEGQRVSYGKFNRWTEAVAAVMVARGVSRGDRVVVQLPNCLEALVLQVAAFRIGAVNVPVVPIYREHETAQILADARPSVVAVAHTLSSRHPYQEVDALLAEIGHAPRLKFLVGSVAPGWSAVPGCDEAIVAELPEPLAAHESALILYTSGTTSAPKGAYLSSRALMAHLKNFATAMRLGAEEVLAVGTPLSHLGGFVAGVVFPAYLGARSVIMAGWNPDHAVQLIEQEHVTLMMGATIFLQDLVERYAKGAAPSHRLTNYVCAGSTIPPRVIRAAEAMGVNATRNYGMTETAGICTAADQHDPLEMRSDWDGRLLDEMEIEAVDPDREPLPAGDIGDLRIRGPQLFDGYTDAAVTAAQFDEEGWFYPGDVGQVVDGWVKMTGRSKDIVNRGGEKFSTQDIEGALLSHSDIASVAVTAVPDKRFGEAVGVWLTLTPGVVWQGARKYLEHLDGLKVAKTKFPVEWHVVEEIPTTASGKIQKYRLREMADLEVEVGARL
ncbi:AMP-binding protein [Nocardia sp. R7R-8]|uniref:AMP-binding protein n=1 Tax=Nocardia sp. R7R-8 TaxID=3459304 RepID=UPI00403DA1A8